MYNHLAISFACVSDCDVCVYVCVGDCDVCVCLTIALPCVGRENPWPVLPVISQPSMDRWIYQLQMRFGWY